MIGTSINPDDSRFADRFHLPDIRQHLVGNRRGLVNVHDADGSAAVATEREIGDVEAVPSENGADVTDDAGLIVVGDDDHGAVERRLHRHAVHQHHARRVFSNTAPSTHRSPSLVFSLTDRRLV